MSKLAQGLRLNLPDTLTRHEKVLPHFLEGVIALFADTEAHPQDLLLARRQGRQGQ